MLGEDFEECGWTLTHAREFERSEDFGGSGIDGEGAEGVLGDSFAVEMCARVVHGEEE